MTTKPRAKKAPTTKKTARAPRAKRARLLTAAEMEDLRSRHVGRKGPKRVPARPVRPTLASVGRDPGQLDAMKLVHVCMLLRSMALYIQDHPCGDHGGRDVAMVQAAELTVGALEHVAISAFGRRVWKAAITRWLKEANAETEAEKARAAAQAGGIPADIAAEVKKLFERLAASGQVATIPLERIDPTKAN